MIKMRYNLKKGKSGYYFYDSVLNAEMTLEIVLNKLNDTSIALDKLRLQYNKLNIENLKLNRIIHKINIEIKQ